MPSQKKLEFLARKRKLKGDVKEEVSDEPAAKKVRAARPTQKEIAAETNTLFVRNLAFDTDDAALASFFGQHAPVKHTVVVKDKTTKASLGYGFVSFASAEDAALAKGAIAQEKLGDRIIKVDFAQRRQRDIDSSGVADQPQSMSHPGTTTARHPTTEVIVRNLSFGIRKPDDLIKHFVKFGAIKECRIPRGQGQKMLGFAFVRYKRRACAEAAIVGLNGKEIEGRLVAVDWSEQRSEVKTEEVSAEGKGIPSIKREEGEEEANEEAEGEEEEEEEVDDDDDDDERAFGLIAEADDLSDAEQEGTSDVEDNRMDGDEDPVEDEDSETGEQATREQHNDYTSTLFVRNLLFETTEDSIKAHFRRFGPIRYCKLVRDLATERSRGTAFVRFVHEADAQACLTMHKNATRANSAKVNSLLLQDNEFTLDGRMLDVQQSLPREDAAKAVERNEANKRASEGKGIDRRRMFLLEEGRLDDSSLSDADKLLRTQSYNQRKKMLASNPSLHVSLTRLSVRNLPRHITGPELKYLARQAVVGFGQDAKAGKRASISKDERARDGAAAQQRTAAITQAKIVVEKDGGRSRGYGFIECSSHRYALMCLRWLNGRVLGGDIDLVELKNAHPPKKQAIKADENDRKRRLIVEFAIENIAVVKRRQERERVSREPKLVEATENVPKEVAHNPLGRILSRRRQQKRAKR
ncbi:RNA recognition motif-containing protein [Savitreella phatthalungensis]